MAVFSFHHASAFFPVVVLLLDPRVGGGQALVQGRFWLPLEHFLDEGVVAVAAGDATGRVQVVMPFEFHARNLLHLGQQLVDGDEFAGTEVDRRGNQLVAVHDHVNAFHAVVNVHEAAGGRAVAPDGDVHVLFINGLDDLATERGGGLLAAAVPGAIRAIDVVKAGDVRLHAALGPVFLAEHFGNELLPAVTALGHRRIGVGFLQRADFRILLKQDVVGAGRRGIKVIADTGAIGRFN